MIIWTLSQKNYDSYLKNLFEHVRHFKFSFQLEVGRKYKITQRGAKAHRLLTSIRFTLILSLTCHICYGLPKTLPYPTTSFSSPEYNIHLIFWSLIIYCMNHFPPQFESTVHEQKSGSVEWNLVLWQFKQWRELFLYTDNLNDIEYPLDVVTMVNDIPILNEWLLVSMPIPMEPQRQAIGNLIDL